MHTVSSVAYLKEKCKACVIPVFIIMQITYLCDFDIKAVTKLLSYFDCEN